MISALLLAAGQGQRMNHQSKALLDWKGQSFLQRALRQLTAASLQEIILVTGAYHQAVQDEWDRVKSAELKGVVREVFNPDFAQGILGSIQAGIRHCHAEAVLITLVDLPFLTTADFEAVLEAWRQGDPGQLLRSSHDGVPAHPVIIPSEYFSEILDQTPSDKGCSFLFQKYAQRVRFHEFPHPRGRIDIDTMEDYHAHIAP